MPVERLSFVILEESMVRQYINKNGLKVGDSSREVFEEIMRGTGFVMGENCSFFIENTGLHDKNIVVSKCIDSKKSIEIKKFPACEFQRAFDLFTIWSDR